jgi:hypothetical protein
VAVAKPIRRPCLQRSACWRPRPGNAGHGIVSIIQHELDLPAWPRYRAFVVMALFQARPHVTASKPRSPACHAASVAQPTLAEYYNLPLGAFCPRHWRPAKTKGKVVIGAPGANYRPAMADLCAAGLPAPRAVEQVPPTRREAQARSLGQFPQKALKLKAFSGFLRSEFGGSDLRMFATPTIVMEKANYKGVPRISERRLPSYVEFDGFDARIVSKRTYFRPTQERLFAKLPPVRWRRGGR